MSEYPPQFSVLGVRIHNLAQHRAIELVDTALRRPCRPPFCVYFVNAHTLNLAACDKDYQAVLNAGDLVLPDGTGVRWAARLQGVRVIENLPGTDFVPELFRSTADHGYSYFLLGGDEKTIALAAREAQQSFPGWRPAGFHHGYLTNEELTVAAIRQINAAQPSLLLVGMGNPLQEFWIHRHREQLNVAVCMGIGGLFDFWAGNVSRAPRWLRRLGHEWLWRLFQQPSLKAKRYLLGNPLFLSRVVRERLFRKKPHGEGGNG